MSLSDEQYADFLAAYKKIGSATRAAAAIGVTRSKVQRHMAKRGLVLPNLVRGAKKYTIAKGAKPVPAPHFEPIAADVEEMRAAAGGDYEEPAADVWKREEDRSSRLIRQARESSTFRWAAPGKSLLLVFVSDMHIAPGTPCDFRRMREDAELIRDTPGCYAVLAGDQVDNHVKHKSAILSARSTPEDQYRLFEYYLSILGGKLLVVTSGNHEAWSTHYAGVDVLGRIVREKRVFYSPDEAWLELTVGSQTYVVGVRHQYRYGSSFNQTHTVKQWLRMGPREFDVGVVGHHHEAAIEQVVYRDKFRWVARPGSYQVTSGYSRQYGFNHSVPTCPTFLLHGDAHDVTGWKSLSAMVRSTRALGELGVGRR